MQKAIIVMNAGSSSLKFNIFEEKNLTIVIQGQISGIGTAPKCVIKNAKNEKVHQEKLDEKKSRNELLEYIMQWIEKNMNTIQIVAAGHRVVHGGIKLTEPTIVDDTAIKTMKECIKLSPIHMPHNIVPMEYLKNKYKELKQVACFDTAFHRTNSLIAQSYAIPVTLRDKENLRRFGFHGLSYEYQMHRLKELEPDLAMGRVIACHLGAGASMAAIVEGKSVATTMGFTPLDGLPMGSRTGSIDPGILLYLMQNKGFDANQMENFLYHESGMLGLTNGRTSDFYEIEIGEDKLSKEALEIFAWNAARMIGSLAVAAKGIDAITFTGGVGENAAPIRAMILDQLDFLGVHMDKKANETNAQVISTTDSKVKVFIIPAQEELMIAKHTKKLLS